MKKCTVKVVIIGDSNVGKTSLMQQYIQNTFSCQYKATIGAEFLSKEVLIDDQLVTMQIWDTAGQEKYQSVQRVFYRGTDGCIIVYDLTSPGSFANVEKWREEFFNSANLENTQNFPMVIVGNKADLTMERKVPHEKAVKWCKENGELDHYETSAKTAINVKEAFEGIARKAAEKQKGRLEIAGITKINTTKLNSPAPYTAEGCINC
eukprot:TRINITY_DN723_c0_g1_i15.p1 TRINITY_DN723_c0_g1~~TRINITY_DN723_c0_g1_i15.p1  ORF type:complete len:207 (+),score=77.79 TRINITY_DN723_c0_g1_i15:129-749(+)